MKKLLTASALIALAGSALAQDAMKQIMLTPDADMEGQSSLSEGRQDRHPSRRLNESRDVVVLRIKFPANFQMPPHTHPYSEVVTVISGTVGSTHGEAFEKKGEMLKPSSLWVYPPKHAHYAWTENDEAIVQVQFTGRGGIDYINPADDPRKKTN